MRSTLVRPGLALLALGQGAAAVWALLAPRSFYDDFPGGGGHWVSALPPYNEHLIRDYGSAYLALAVLAAIAALRGEVRLARIAMVVWLVAAVPHLVFHIAHASEGGAGSIVSLGLNVAVPVALLAVLTKEPRTP